MPVLLYCAASFPEQSHINFVVLLSRVPSFPSLLLLLPGQDERAESQQCGGGFLYPHRWARTRHAGCLNRVLLQVQKWIKADEGGNPFHGLSHLLSDPPPAPQLPSETDAAQTMAGKPRHRDHEVTVSLHLLERNRTIWGSWKRVKWAVMGSWCKIRHVAEC